MSANIVVLDAGNSDIKARAASREAVWSHALAELSTAEWNQIMAHSRDNPPAGYARVNGTPFAYGEMAEKRGPVQRRSGAARYQKGYYDILTAISLAQLYKRGGRVFVFASHAPRDITYADDLLEATVGEYTVETEGRTAKFTVAGAMTFDEPVGGLMNVVLKDSGLAYARPDINGGESLVIDIGGFTTDMISVARGGQLDYAVNESVEVGIQNVMRAFERDLRARYADIFKSTTTVPANRLRDALRTGAYTGGGREYPCHTEATNAAGLVLNRIANAYQEVAGGPARWDTIILTGGGSAALYDRLLPILDHGRVLPADDLDALHLANVRGGMKLARFYEANGVIDV
jgi:hypothetical protein